MAVYQLQIMNTKIKNHKSSHLPKNTTITTPLGKAELFWQTTNCNHFMQNYRDDSAKTKPGEKTHNLQFSDVSRMLSSNVVINPVKNSHKFYAISYWNDRYYYTIFTLQRRTDAPDALFAVIITTYISYEARVINEYKAHIAESRTRYGY